TAASARRSRSAYGAPEAPVTPRKTRTPEGYVLLVSRSFGSRQERAERREVVGSEVRVRTHDLVPERRRVRQVLDEVGGVVRLTDRGEIRRAEDPVSLSEVRVAVETARLREELRTGFGLLVPRESLLLGPRRNEKDELGAECLLRRRALP